MNLKKKKRKKNTNDRKFADKGLSSPFSSQLPFSKTSWGVGRVSPREALWDRYLGQSLVVTERQTVDVKRFDQKMIDFIIDDNDIPFIDCSDRMISTNSR